MDKCKVNGCDSKIKQSGYCSKHYSQVYRHGRLTPEKERNIYKKSDKCKHRGCTEIAKIKNYCQTHYSQYRNYGKTYDKKKAENVIEQVGEKAILKIISTTKHIVAESLVDIEDVEKISKYMWYFDGRYVLRGDRKISLHRYLMDAPGEKVVDHINHNKLDNRKKNLRVCTVAENTMSHRGYSSNTSGTTGVYFENNRWRARIRVNGKLLSLGVYEEKQDAIEARKDAEKKYFGEFGPTK